jgi:hypothetical protein
VSQAVRLPLERAKDSLVTKEIQLGRAAFLGNVLFVTLIDIPPSLRGRDPEQWKCSPSVSFIFKAWEIRNVGPEDGNWE